MKYDQRTQDIDYQYS